MDRKHVVYMLQSEKHPAQRYVGVTSKLRQRIAEHNSGKSTHTDEFRPWRLVAAVWFQDEPQALTFEGYLKSGSGRAFANRHFWPAPCNRE